MLPAFLVGLSQERERMMRKAALLLPTGVLLLASMTGCPNEAPVTKTPPVDEAVEMFGSQTNE
mgnify:CR=1 FL=1